MERIYSFAIVRVSPDPRRGELVNIGIVVFLQGRLDVKLLPSLAKVHALHAEMDLSELHVLPQRLAEYAKAKRSVGDRHALIRRVGMVELSELGQFRASGENEYNGHIEQLLTRLVRPTTASAVMRGVAQSRLHIQVRRVIREAKILGRQKDDINKHKIVSNFPLSPEKGLYADFVGKNSKFYVTEAVDFRVDRGIEGAKFNETAKAAMVLREFMSQQTDSHRILLYAASSEMESRVRPHLNLAGEFATEFINFESPKDRAKYVQQLAKAFGGELPLN